MSSTIWEVASRSAEMFPLMNGIGSAFRIDGNDQGVPLKQLRVILILVLSFFSSFQNAYSDGSADDTLRLLDSARSLIVQNSNRYSSAQLRDLNRLATELKQVANNSGSGQPGDCYQKAYTLSGINYDAEKATELCSGGGTLETAACFAGAYSASGINYDSDRAITLCKRGGDLRTKNCFVSSYSASGINYNAEKAIALCAGRGTEETSNCFKAAYSMSGINYDESKAIQLCKYGGTMDNVSCFSKAYSQNYDAAAALRLCRN